MPSKFSSTMPAASRGQSAVLGIRIPRIVLVTILGLVLFLLYRAQVNSIDFSNRDSISLIPVDIAKTRLPKHDYAFCTFLAPREEGKEDEEDVYYIGTRMLIYQLLHDPETRSTSGIPFVVMAAEGVSPEKKTQLMADGATVVEVSPIEISWIKPGRSRWTHVMDKLHMWKLTAYKKVLLLDTDMVVVRRLDDLFVDPATDLRQNLNLPENSPENEPEQPQSYVMAGNSGPYADSWPERGRRVAERLNAGFVIFMPSHEMYNYLMAIVQIEGNFPGTSPEQDLWNYVHRRKGNMPWQQVDPLWTINTPTFEDYKQGVATFHEKYWGCARDRNLRDILLKSRWKMEGFFNAQRRHRIEPPARSR